MHLVTPSLSSCIFMYSNFWILLSPVVVLQKVEVDYQQKKKKNEKKKHTE